ncbi:hypothetical protein SRHO_G00009670 [Serrasalmus rhombeus]
MRVYVCEAVRAWRHMADLCDMKQARGRSERSLTNPKLQWTLETTEKLQTTENPHTPARAVSLRDPSRRPPLSARTGCEWTLLRGQRLQFVQTEGDRLSAVWRSTPQMDAGC